MAEIPDLILKEHFHRFVHGAESKYGGLVGSCPICNEGKSFGKKKRFYYAEQYKWFTCRNCNASISGWDFLNQVCNYSNREIYQLLEESGDLTYLDSDFSAKPIETEDVLSLPPLSYNLFGDSLPDGDYYINIALKEIKRRRLDRAVNKSNLYLCKEPVYPCNNSSIHQNRLIIPHYNVDEEVTFFQSRAITKNQEEFCRYVSCLNSKMTLWGLNNISTTSEHLFITEGALDAFFVKNCIATGGLKLNEIQQRELSVIEGWYDVVWCFDNDFSNPDVVGVYEKALSCGKNVFMWGGEFSGVKDFNQYCMETGVNEIEPEKILAHTYTGNKGLSILDSKTKVKV